MSLTMVIFKLKAGNIGSALKWKVFFSRFFYFFYFFLFFDHYKKDSIYDYVDGTSFR